jgi:hypothetical protein
MHEALPKIQMERLPKRDAIARLRAVYACLERGWRARQRVLDQQAKRETIRQEEVR